MLLLCPMLIALHSIQKTYCYNPCWCWSNKCYAFIVTGIIVTTDVYVVVRNFVDVETHHLNAIAIKHSDIAVMSYAKSTAPNMKILLLQTMLLLEKQVLRFSYQKHYISSNIWDDIMWSKQQKQKWNEACNFLSTKKGGVLMNSELYTLHD